MCKLLQLFAKRFATSTLQGNDMLMCLQSVSDDVLKIYNILNIEV